MDWIQIYSILLGIGLFQGVIMAWILLSRRGTLNFNVNYWVSLMLLFFSYRLLTALLVLSELLSVNSWLYHIFIDMNWIYGPLIYFATKNLVYPKKAFHPKDYLHFIPFVLEFLWSNYIRSLNFYWDGTAQSISKFGYYGYIIWIQTPIQYIIAAIIMLVYGYVSYKLIRQHSNPVYQLKPKIQTGSQQLLLGYLVFSVIILVVLPIDYFLFKNPYPNPIEIPIHIVVAILTYILGLVAILNGKTAYWDIQRQISEDPELKTLFNKIHALVKEEELFLSPQLSVKDIAVALDEKPYKVTKALNEVHQKSFSDFINDFRVNDFKERLRNPKNDHKTLLALAFESGFNSKATFQRIIKKHTGHAPGHLKKEIQGSN